MDTHPELLQTEEILNSLLSELENIKSASNQVSEMQTITKTVVSSTEKVISDSGSLVKQSQELLTVIKNYKINKRFDKVDGNINEMKMVMNQEINHLNNKYDNLKESTERNSKRNQILLILVLLLNASLIALNFIKV